MRQTAFLRCFLTQERDLTEKTTVVASLTHVRVVVDRTLPIGKLKISHRFIDQCIRPIRSSSSVKKSILSNRFSTLFTDNILMRCSSSVVNIARIPLA